ncbi:M48 family metalloprotease [Loktanella sp. Alg231-35]|uniref:M48 family metalloprotease n=1 Tax=Loktanella sp. Alg231-35 TaxID=1922220 RepID=UPI00131F01EB|nr:M48 family metalloprotease [Loktanella sp. Alg231-35]
MLTILAALVGCGHVGPSPAAVETTQLGHLHFWQAASRVEPVAEALCEARAPARHCDFRIVLDEQPNLAADAGQSVGRDGRPVLTVTAAMVARARHLDELAFVLAHEAAHHIQDHLPRLRQIASQSGEDPAAGSLGVMNVPTEAGIIRAHAQLNRFELEADALGAQIAAVAGFDPLNGVRILQRLDDLNPGASISHPALADRLRVVRNEIAG